MRRFSLIFVVSLFFLQGCATPKVAPQAACPDTSITLAGGLYFADHEDIEPPNPYENYHVYLLFVDGSQFTFWRTHEEPQQVQARFFYYTHEHPGVTKYSSYTVQGGAIHGSRKLRDTAPDVKPNTFVQTYEGRIEGCLLYITQSDSYVYDDGSKTKPIVYRWKMVRVMTSEK